MNSPLSTYLQYGRGKLGQFGNMVSLNKHVPPELIFEVESGPQAGSQAKLSQDNIFIGSNWEADLLLQSLGQEKITIASKQSVFGPLVQVSSSSHNVMVDGETVTPDYPPKRLPITIEVDADRIVVSDLNQYIDGSVIQEETSQTLIAILSLVFLLLCLILYQVTKAPESRVLFSSDSAPRNSLGSIISAAKTAVVASNLADAISVRSRDTDAIVVSGSVTERQKKVWADLRVKLDSIIGAHTAIYDIRYVKSLSGIPAIGLVSLSDPSYIVLKGGGRIGLGETLINGWTVSKIERGSITVSNGLESIELGYGLSND